VQCCLSSNTIEYIPLGRSKETKSNIKQNQTHPLLVFAVDVNLLDENSDTINKSIDVPLVAGEEVGLEVCAEKIVYILIACQKNAGKNHNINMMNTCFDSVGELKYQGMILTN